MHRVAVIIVAAGRGERFGGDGPKQYAMLAGKSLIRHAAETFAAHPAVCSVLPVIHADDADLCADALAGIPCLSPVVGGESRQASVGNGLRALADHVPDLVLVHDAARPLVPNAVIDAVLDALQTHAGAVPGMAVVDTMKRTDDNGLVTDTVPRANMWRAQTPQGFRFDLLAAAHDAAADMSATDDAQLMETAGHAVIVVPGAERSLKVTTQGDLRRLEEIMKNDRGTAPQTPRVGSGFDVHRLGAGDGVTLCGIDIACNHALIGHSDADVAMHALTDAILGALGAGDIGSHFPPSDERWRGVASEVFLSHACTLAEDAGLAVGNADVTIICEQPKVGPHREAMRENLARIMDTDVANVSVKATTTEKLGFAGRREGIAAQTTVLLIPTS